MIAQNLLRLTFILYYVKHNRTTNRYAFSYRYLSSIEGIKWAYQFTQITLKYRSQHESQKNQFNQLEF